MSWLGFGLRDVMLLLVALAAVYLVVMLLRLVQIGRHRHAVLPEKAPEQKIDTVSPLRRREEPELESAPPAAAVPPAPTFEWEDVKDLFDEPAAAEESALPAPPRQGGFGEHLADHLARSEMEMEVQRMRDEMERMRAEVDALRNARRVSPQYAEAMELAQRGGTAQDIADQMGISLAEAELVQALSRGKNNFAEGDENGEQGYAAGSGGLDPFGRRRAG